MKCEDFDKLFHLYSDGEIDEKESKELEEHLSSCRRCVKKLSELKNFEVEAKRIKLKEPSPVYWQTFAKKVSDKIILRKRKSIWAKIKSAWESIFVYSPAKLRIAAGIVSVLLVFIIGKLYWDYKGKDLERIRTERMEEALRSQAQKKSEKIVPVVKESRQIESQLKQTTEADSVKVPIDEKTQEKKGEKPQRGLLKTQVGFVVRDSAKNSLHVKRGRAGEVAHIISIPESTSAETEKSEPLSETTLYLQSPTLRKSTIEITAEQPVQPEEGKELFQIEGLKYYEVDKNWVRTLSEKDTLVEVDTLKKVISTWSEFFDKKPETEWSLEGFSQIKIAFHLLFLKSKDESSLDEGIKLLNKYKESAVEQKTKDDINNKITGLEALRKK